MYQGKKPYIKLAHCDSSVWLEIILLAWQFIWSKFNCIVCIASYFKMVLLLLFVMYFV